MRPSIFTTLAAALRLASGSPFIKRQNNGGYLAAVFTGGEEQVFFNLAPPDQPQTFRTLNGGQPVLRATEGTRGARDPSILVTQDNSKLYALATDLCIGCGTDFGTAQKFGSRKLHVWESQDGVNWSSDRLTPDLMPETAGYVWAPSAVWDADRGAYAIFWASAVYEEGDTDRTGLATGPFIYFSHTSDFTTFTEAQRWNPNNPDTVIDQEIQLVSGSTYIRYLSDTNRVRRVVVEKSTNGLFGDWQQIGVPVDQVREGPASFRSIQNPDLFYLWEDNYNGGGYECYQTQDFSVPFAACPSAIQPGGMRHGSVVAIDGTRYDALSRL